MNDLLLKLYVLFQDLKNREDGQDLVEYAMMVALIAFGAVAGHEYTGHGPQQRVQHHQHNSG